MRLIYITPKKDYQLISKVIFDNAPFLYEIEMIRKIRNRKKTKVAIKNLMRKFKINKSYELEIIEFVESKGWRDADNAFDKDGLVVQIPKTSKPLKSYFLKVGPNTKLPDLMEAFKLMEVFRNEDLTRARGRKRNRSKADKNLDRDVYVFQLADKGFHWEHIANFTQKKFGGGKVSETHIRMIYNNICEKLERKKKDRRKIYSLKSKSRIRNT